jgi:hypothetical protein
MNQSSVVDFKKSSICLFQYSEFLKITWLDAASKIESQDENLNKHSTSPFSFFPLFEAIFGTLVAL